MPSTVRPSIVRKYRLQARANSGQLGCIFFSEIPDLEARLKDAAGDVELVIDKSENYLLDKRRWLELKNADANLLWLNNTFVGMERCKGLTAKQQKNIIFTDSRRLPGPAIAEHAIAMTVALSKGLPACQRA